MNYLISYPRSGNTMARYLIELMTRRPTNGLIGAVNPRDNLQQPLIHKDRDDYILHKRHDFSGVEESDFIFFLIRDPLECTIRHNEQPRGIAEHQMRGYLDSWFALLKQMDDHNNGIVLYYEEMLEVGMKASRVIYRNPQSTGPHFHKAKLGSAVVQRLHSYMNEHYGELIKKYL